MKIRSLLAASVLGLAASMVGQAPPAPSVTVLKAARIFDGRTDAVVPGGIVVVEGSKILAVGAAAAIPAGATVIDLGDATLLPGFIDSHTHVTDEAGDGSSPFGPLDRTLSTSLAKASSGPAKAGLMAVISANRAAPPKRLRRVIMVFLPEMGHGPGCQWVFRYSMLRRAPSAGSGQASNSAQIQP